MTFFKSSLLLHYSYCSPIQPKNTYARSRRSQVFYKKVVLKSSQVARSEVPFYSTTRERSLIGCSLEKYTSCYRDLQS